MPANKLTTEQRGEIARQVAARLTPQRRSEIGRYASSRRWEGHEYVVREPGPGRGFRNPANFEAGMRSREAGVHTRIVGPLRSWEGIGRRVSSLADLYREGEVELLEDELDVLCEPESIGAIELRALLRIRDHVTRGRSVGLPGSRRDRQRRYNELCALANMRPDNE